MHAALEVVSASATAKRSPGRVVRSTLRRGAWDRAGALASLTAIPGELRVLATAGAAL